ncbi:relaxase/mobilization nuclease domain-containing protein [Sphingopyxis sp. USTB-05]|uniref:relaxase/mobilization nuclease domain-containing protein n=1 Tax=Sphingopyxis sp. USTB-05 TaxID=2830667 RepID=UPI00207851A1|nr:relaxase/mobilization nuclease domain-containing protein [Sphingopyxis sp. USTB-05]USI79093.1 relaxase/mobilization nuclease domain-containing protein [Sphingopyxis sp. USTB-05]
MISNITWGADFAGIVRYLVENRVHEVLDLKGVTSVELAADEMAAVAALSTRAKNVLLHISLSAAIEDGALDADQWRHCASEITIALRLVGLQRVVVRHSDKAHDHVHIFYCTIDPETGQTPPKHWFLRKGNAVDDIGPHALSDAEVDAVPVSARALRTYDFRALARVMDTCRKLERQLGLRALRTPSEAAQARLAGEAKDKPAAPQRRSDRVGSIPLMERAEEIRSALDTPDWPSKRDALCAAGLDFEPIYRTTKKTEELRGLVIFDAADPGNRIRASNLDLPDRKYGLRRLEARHASEAESFERWWPERTATRPGAPLGPGTDRQRLKDGFDLLALQHAAAERDKRVARHRLRKEQALERARKRRLLMIRRRREAAQLPASERRGFYRQFSLEVSRLELAALSELHSQQARPLARGRKPTWNEYLKMRADAGDIAAARLITQSPAKAVARVAAKEQVIVRGQPVLAKPRAPVPTFPQTIVAANPTDIDPADLMLAYKAMQQRGRD